MPKIALFMHDREDLDYKSSEEVYQFLKNQYKIELTYLRDKLSIFKLSDPPKKLKNKTKQYSSMLIDDEYLQDIIVFHEWVVANNNYMKSQTKQMSSQTFIQATELEQIFISLMRDKSKLEEFFFKSIQEEIMILFKPQFANFKIEVHEQCHSLTDMNILNNSFGILFENKIQDLQKEFQARYGIDFNQSQLLPNFVLNQKKEISNEYQIKIEQKIAHSAKQNEEKKRELNREAQRKEAITEAKILKNKIWCDVFHCPGCKSCFNNAVCHKHKAEYYNVDQHPDNIRAICAASGENYCISYEDNNNWECTGCKESFKGGWYQKQPKHINC